MVKCCYPLKSEPIYHKINILIQIKGIEGIPVIIRFKTYYQLDDNSTSFCIEGIPVIIRFKTEIHQGIIRLFDSIEGIPVIIRFKTI